MTPDNVALAWLIVAVILVCVSVYLIGYNEHDSDDLLPMIFVSIAASVAWPLLVVAAILAAPFYLIYKLGNKHSEIAEDKKKMWESLKK